MEVNRENKLKKSKLFLVKLLLAVFFQIVIIIFISSVAIFVSLIYINTNTLLGPYHLPIGVVSDCSIIYENKMYIINDDRIIDSNYNIIFDVKECYGDNHTKINNFCQKDGDLFLTTDLGIVKVSLKDGFVRCVDCPNSKCIIIKDDKLISTQKKISIVNKKIDYYLTVLDVNLNVIKGEKEIELNEYISEYGIFINNRGQIQDCSLESYSFADFGRDSLLMYNETGIIKMSISGSNLLYNENVIGTLGDYDNYLIGPKFMCNNNYLYFYTLEEHEKRKCYTVNPCICSSSNYVLWKYDYKNDELIIVKKLLSDDILIDYNFDSIEYYSDGAFYRDGIKKVEFTKLELNDAFYIKPNSVDRWAETRTIYVNYKNEEFYIFEMTTSDYLCIL